MYHTGHLGNCFDTTSRRLSPAQCTALMDMTHTRSNLTMPAGRLHKIYRSSTPNIVCIGRSGSSYTRSNRPGCISQPGSCFRRTHRTRRRSDLPRSNARHDNPGSCTRECKSCHWNTCLRSTARRTKAEAPAQTARRRQTRAFAWRRSSCAHCDGEIPQRPHDVAQPQGRSTSPLTALLQAQRMVFTG